MLIFWSFFSEKSLNFGNFSIRSIQIGLKGELYGCHFSRNSFAHESELDPARPLIDDYLAANAVLWQTAAFSQFPFLALPAPRSDRFLALKTPAVVHVNRRRAAALCHPAGPLRG
jgi:hypothetical protein